MLKYLLIVSICICTTLNAQDAQDSLRCGVGIPKNIRFIKAPDHNCVDSQNRKQRLWKTYAKKGRIKEEVTYKDGQMTGPATTYYKNGKIKEQAEYFENKKYGKYICNFRNGLAAADGAYNYNVKSGNWKYYYKTTDKVKMEGAYLNGKCDGDWNYYDTDGQLSRIVTYAKGKKVKSIKAYELNKKK